MQDFWKEGRPQQGLLYAEYLEEMARDAAADASSYYLPKSHKHLALNYQRSLRGAKSTVFPQSLEIILNQIAAPQLWMALTEGWCGDSAQCLPVIAKIAEAAPAIDLRILYRDQNRDIMQEYLTQGKEAIPKLVAFDTEGTELFRWGPRPKDAAALFSSQEAAGIPRQDIYRNLHLWYGRDRGKSTLAEIQHLLEHSLSPRARQ